MMDVQRRDKPWVGRFAQFLDEYPLKVHSQEQLAGLLDSYGAELGVPASLRVSRLISVLKEEQELEDIKVRREIRGQLRSETKTRYIWRKASPYAIGTSLRTGSYLSHASAMFLHALSDQLPKTVYVNKEQSVKPRNDSELNQSSINRAFKRPPRRSTYIFATERARYVLLNGKNTGRLEVSQLRTPQGELVDATKLERTLIDIVVRPAYAGGVREVLEAYQTAASHLSVNTLIATLKKLDYTYPYHQAIGFLLQRAGMGEAQLKKFDAIGVRWDFYIAHQITDPVFDSRWRLFYPKGL